MAQVNFSTEPKIFHPLRSIRERVDEVYTEESDRKLLAEIFDYIDSSAGWPVSDIDLSQKLSDQEIDAVAASMLQQAKVALHPLNSEKHPHLASYLVMMKTLGETLKENGQPLTDVRKEQLKHVVVAYAQDVIEPDNIKQACAGIYDALESADNNKYQEVISSESKKKLAEQQEQKRQSKNSTLMVVGGGLLAGGAVAYLAGKAQGEKEKSSPDAPNKNSGGNGLTFLGVASFVIGAVVAGWAWYSKAAPANAGQGRSAN